MNTPKKITTALISVYYKDKLDAICLKLNELGVKLISTGGTHSFIQSLGLEAEKVEDLTGFPSILGGRVKTLHPNVFGGILARRDEESDKIDMEAYNMQNIDLVIVDLYPFEQTLAQGASHAEVIEKIDIGGISLIRAAAKNYADVAIISDSSQYDYLLGIMNESGAITSFEQRYYLATQAFNKSSAYDMAIYQYFDAEKIETFKVSNQPKQVLRYGENPHQKGYFYGDMSKVFTQLNGKEISYNNLLDIEAAIRLISEFEEPTFAIIKHNNACGLATDSVLSVAYSKALAGDPVSAFGGVIITNRKVDVETANLLDSLFFEVLLAPEYDDQVLEVLKKKKNRILLHLHNFEAKGMQYRSMLNGVLVQEYDNKTEVSLDLKVVTNTAPDANQTEDLLFANKIVKHLKSNAIVLAKNRQLLGNGAGQTSRVDALKQSIEKAKAFGFELNGAVLASDAFFPFSDSLEIASKEGISSVIQPGGSVRDAESINLCNEKNISMVFTGFRHFKH